VFSVLQDIIRLFQDIVRLLEVKVSA